VNKVAVIKQQAITNIEPKNFYEQYGDTVGRSNIVGRLLKFSKGDWLAGQDNEEIEEGTRLTVNMKELLVGWIKWVDSKPAEQIMGPIHEGYKPQKREELGDTDEDGWEIDTNGKPRDPWQFSNYVIMKAAGEQYSEAEAFTFATSSYGGISAIAALAKEFGNEMRKRPDEYPIVELGVRAYDHPNKEYGRIKNPTFAIVGWESKDLFEPGAEPAKKIAPAKKKAGKR